MWSKVFTPLLTHRLTPAEKFPQLQLRVGQQRRVTCGRQLSIPLSSFDSHSLDFARREIEPGSVVELRDADHRKLLALAFYEPALLRVDIFHHTPKVVTDLPRISEDFFVNRVKEAWGRRQSVFRHVRTGSTNAYRVVNGYADGVPSLYVDLFSSSFARVVATSAGAERIVPAVTELLRQHGVEEVLLDTPHLKDHEKLTLITPTITLPETYMENGASNMWLPRDEYPTTSSNRWLINTAHRRIRAVLRDLCHGKRVLCVNDRGGAAALQAVMTAKSVVFAESDESLLNRVRENLVANHASAVFNTCETTNSPIEELSMRQQDVVFLEHRFDTLSSPEQWQNLLKVMLFRGVCGKGSIVVVAQEVALLGMHDYVASGGGVAASVVRATRSEMFNVFNRVTAEHGLRARLLRFFGPSIDYPTLPAVEAGSYSYAFLLELAS
ncbi:hypothetical protein DPX39_060040100 [Trypanosoma brucei equiperdum]|uniref:Uncharacterized protein n=1 Tax=Trypanosoma brucei equiperdum TaxID=630700 RepID=A0A3L6L9H5_9TRYP|nr:hypothetical protein DPX39_060040100 [Trypanosoma brucei equiperdum]